MLPVYRWTKEEREDAQKQAADADRDAKEHTAIAKSPARQKRIYESEVEQIEV